LGNAANRIKAQQEDQLFLRAAFAHGRAATEVPSPWWIA
jgi:hypothetical protein